jgi:hypothetical protein
MNEDNPRERIDEIRLVMNSLLKLNNRYMGVHYTILFIFTNV